MKQFTRNSSYLNNTEVLYTEMSIDGSNYYIHAYDFWVGEYADRTLEILKDAETNLTWVDTLSKGVISMFDSDLKYDECAMSVFEMHFDEIARLQIKVFNSEFPECEITSIMKGEEETETTLAKFILADKETTAEIISSYVRSVLSVISTEESLSN